MKAYQGILGTFFLLFAIQIQAQANVKIMIHHYPNRGGGCQNQTQYVYMPEIECYYDTYTQEYVYLSNRCWCRSPYLPQYYAGYDVYRAPKVVLDYKGYTPWVSFNIHKKRYCKRNYYSYYHNYYGPSYNRDYDTNDYYRYNEEREYRRTIDDDQDYYRRYDQRKEEQKEQKEQQYNENRRFNDYQRNYNSQQENQDKQPIYGRRS